LVDERKGLITSTDLSGSLQRFEVRGLYVECCQRLVQGEHSLQQRIPMLSRGNQLEAILAATLVFDIAEVCRMATLVAYVSAVDMRLLSRITPVNGSEPSVPPWNV
jgi:hypothetical protein